MFGHLLILLKMTIKKIVPQLERHIFQEYPHFHGKFYANRRNNYVHLGLDKSLFSIEDFKIFLKSVDDFLREHLRSEFKKVDPPKLDISAKWNHNYIIRPRHD